MKDKEHTNKLIEKHGVESLISTVHNGLFEKFGPYACREVSELGDDKLGETAIETLRLFYGEEPFEVLYAIQRHSEEFDSYFNFGKMIPFLLAYIVNVCGYDAIDVVRTFFEGEKTAEEAANTLDLNSSDVYRILHQSELFRFRISKKKEGWWFYFHSIDKRRAKYKVRKYVEGVIEKIKGREREITRLRYSCPTCDYTASFDSAFGVDFRCPVHGALLIEEKAEVPKLYRKCRSELESLLQNF